MSEKLSHLLTSVQPDSFISQDSIFGWRADPAFGEGKRVGALFFARHLDCFIMTRQFTSIYQDLVPFRQIIVTRNFSATYRDWQKTMHRDADGT